MGGVAKGVGKVIGGVVGAVSPKMPKQSAAAEAGQVVADTPPVQPPAPPKPEAVPQLPTPQQPSGNLLTKGQVEDYIKSRTGLTIEATGGAANKIIKERGLGDDFMNYAKSLNAFASNGADYYRQQTQVMLDQVPGTVQEKDRSILMARDRERRRRLRLSAKNNTIISGAPGVTAPAPTASKQLFGQ